MSANETQEVDEGALLRGHLFAGELIQLPLPPEARGQFVPEWFDGELPALLYPPMGERGLDDGATVELQVSPYTIYYGALRELAETADADRSDSLRKLILEWNPNAPQEVVELARAHVEQDLETALLHYELALEMDGDFYEATQDAGMCEYALAGAGDADREERLGAAEEYFRRAIEMRPEAALSWWSLARVLNDQGVGEDAQAVLQQYLAEYPDGEGREMVEEALAQGFEMQGPTDEQVAFIQAQQMAFGEDPQGAIDLLQPLAQAYPESAEIWFVLGAGHRRVGNADEAERCLRRAARLAPTEPFVQLELTRAYLDMEQWKPAETSARKALELDPENPGFLVLLGRALLGLGDREGAEEAIGSAQEMVPDDPEVQEALALLEA